MESSPKNGKIIDTESFTPVKVPAGNTSYKRKIPGFSKKSSESLSHTQGLSTDHALRRNTIHHQPINPGNLAQTPSNINDGSHFSFSKKTFSMTSPRINHFKSFDLEGFRTLRKKLEVPLSGSTAPNKENRDPFQSSPHSVESNSDHLERFPVNVSSPLKRQGNENDGRSKRTKKGETDSIQYSDHASVDIDEVFHREDIVGRIAARPLFIGDDRTYKPVIDNESESDYDAREKSENIKQNENFGENDTNHTQLSKIIALDSSQDYMTPERSTEPVAKSPTTNQQTRINEDLNLSDSEITSKSDTKDVTSPLKNHRIQEDDSNSMNGSKLGVSSDLRDSLNSRPVFSVHQIDKIQAEFAEELEQLHLALNERNQEIIKLNQEILDAGNERIMREQELKEIKQLQKSLTINEEILGIQIKHDKGEIAALSEALTTKEGHIKNLELKLSRNKSKIQNLIGQLNFKFDEIKSLNFKLEEARKSLDQQQKRISESNEELSTLKAVVETKNDDISKLTDYSSKLDSHIEVLLSDKAEYLKELDDIKNSQSELSIQLENERNLNMRQEELVRELDKLENLAKDKINNLEESLKSKDKELEERSGYYESTESELKSLQNELESITVDRDRLRCQNDSLSLELQKLGDDMKILSSRSDEISNLKTESIAKVSNLEFEITGNIRVINELKLKVESLVNEIEHLNKVNEGKNSTITDDTKRMTELVNAIDQQRDNYESKISKLHSEIRESKISQEDAKTLREENANLKDQVRASESLVETKISEVATYLHKEYAEKHVKKLRDVKDKYEKEFNVLTIENKGHQREIDSLKKKLASANEECQRISEFVHLNKLNYSTRSSTTSSPKKSHVARSRY